MKRFDVLIMGLVLAGCSSGGSGGASGKPSPVSMKYANAVSTQGNVMRDQVLDAPLTLFFGQIGIDAYYYRPGAGSVVGVASNPTANNIDNADWSEWDMIQLGGSAGVDFLLPGNTAVPIQTASYWSLPQEVSYAANVGVFGFDVIFIQGMPNIVMADNTVCGENYFPYGVQVVESSFPNLQFFEPGTPQQTGSPDCYKLPLYNNEILVAENNTFALVIRNDWFPDPITLTYQTGTYGDMECYTTSSPLSPFQAEIIDSVMAQESGAGGVIGFWPAGMYQSSCVFNPVGGNLASSIFISPETTGEPIVQITQAATALFPTMTPGGNTIPQGGQEVFGSVLDAQVSFDLQASDISNWSVVSNPADYYGCTTSDCTAFGGDETIDMLPAANGAPWGLQVDFTVSTPPVATPSPTPAP